MVTRRFVVGSLCALILAGAFVTASAQDRERFYVTGFVKTPGAFVLTPNMTVGDGIAAAGGITERGSDRGILILRIVDNQTTQINASISDLLQHNDTIRVRQRLAR